jgi:hypothetical protein
MTAPRWRKPNARDHGAREGALRLGLREHTGAGRRRKMASRSIPAFHSLHSVAPLRSPSHVSVCSEFTATCGIHVRGLVFILPRPIPNRHNWILVAIPRHAHDGEENPHGLFELLGRRNSATRPGEDESDRRAPPGGDHAEQR